MSLLYNYLMKKRTFGRLYVVLTTIFFLISSSVPGQDVQTPVKIGVVSMITPRDTVEYYQELIDYISAKLNRPVEMVFKKTYDEMDRLLEMGEVDAAFICSAPYVLNRKRFGAELLAVPQVNGKALYKSFIIVHKDSNINSFDELEGKTFAFTDPKSNSGRLYPAFRLAKQGRNPEEFFRKYMYSYSHNKSIELVAKKKVDGAAVESLIYQFMQQKDSPYINQTRIIEMSPDFGIPPLVTTPRASNYIKRAVKDVLIQMHREPEGERILASMQVDKFVHAPDSNYDSVRNMQAFVSMNQVSDKEIQREQGVIFLGVVPRDNPRIAYEKYQPIIDYLSESTPFEFELSLQKSYEDVVDALGHGDVDIAFLGPLTYLLAYKEYGAVSILRSINEKGDNFYRSVIVARNDDSVKLLTDLRGKDFAFAALESTSGNLIPRLALAEEGIHLKELKSYHNFNSHESVIKWVLKGKYDAGAVRESVAKKYLSRGLKILSRSGPIPTGPVVVGPKTPYTIVAGIKQTLLDMNKTDYGRELLKKTDSEMKGGFIEAGDLDYEHIRKLINKVPTTCGVGCHPKLRL